MEREKVESKIIDSIGYDENKEILEVEFKKTGAIYHYFDVPKNIYDDLMTASSKGSYVNGYIKKSSNYRRVK